MKEMPRLLLFLSFFFFFFCSFFLFSFLSGQDRRANPPFSPFGYPIPKAVRFLPRTNNTFLPPTSSCNFPLDYNCRSRSLSLATETGHSTNAGWQNNPAARMPASTQNSSLRHTLLSCCRCCCCFGRRIRRRGRSRGKSWFYFFLSLFISPRLLVLLSQVPVPEPCSGETRMATQVRNAEFGTGVNRIQATQGGLIGS